MIYDLRHWLTLIEKKKPYAPTIKDATSAKGINRKTANRILDPHGYFKPKMPIRESAYEDELHGIEQQLKPLMARWQKIVAEPSKDSGWQTDPARGGLWPQTIYPLNQRKRELEKLIAQERRTAKLQALRDSNGFDTNEILYHGTNHEFTEFDRQKARTAAHIYTSPDLETARAYGDIVYAVYGRQEPQADLSIENSENPEFYSLCRRIHRRGGFKSSYDLSLDEFIETLTSGDLYGTNGRLQDDIVDVCLDMKFKSVRITDAKPGGGYSDSVIFGNPADLQIIEEIEGTMER
jgi:hypothetical protein